MRLTLINQFYAPDISPTARLVTSLAEHRAALGDVVTVVSSRGGYVQRGVAGDTTGNPRVFRIWTPQVGKATAGRRLADWATFYLLAFWRVVTLPPQDVIISLTTPPYIALAAMFHKAIHRRTRLVLWNMDCYPDVVERAGLIRRGGIISRALRMINRVLFRQVDGLICLDPAMRRLLVSQYMQRGKRLATAIIPNWEPADEFPADQPPRPWDDPTAAALQGRFVVLYMGNAGYGHEFDTALAVAEALRNEPFTFLFVGGGSRRAWIERQRQDRGLTNLLLHDYVPEPQKRSVLALADCALITLADSSLGVMSPSKLHANLAMGVPVLYIGPAESNVDQAIGQFHCGGSFRKGDVDGATAFIRELQADRQRRSEFSRRSRHAFEEAYCDTRVLPAFNAVLNLKSFHHGGAIEDPR